MTAQITTIPGGTSQAAVSGTTIRAEPGVRYEIADIAPDGTVGPALTAAQLVLAPNVPDLGDMSVTLPDGTVLVFKGLVELFALGAGLSVGGDLVVASLEDLIAPAAGDAGTAPDGGGSSQAFNLASPGSPNDFGEAPEGRFDPEGSDIAPLTGEDPNDFVAPAAPAPGAAPAPETGVLFTAGNDVAYFDRDVPALLADGTPNPDFARLSGSSGNVDPRNVMQALGNDDLVRLDDAGGVNNLKSLGELLDVPAAFYGGGGNDTVHGGTDEDRVFGGTDEDRVYGGGGDDTVYGGGGDDTVYGGEGNDVLFGDVRGVESGDDVLYGGDGDDTLYADGIDDITVEDLGGKDTLEGGAGNDTFVFNLKEATGDDVIEDFVLGEDTLRFNGVEDFLGYQDILGDREKLIVELEKLVDVTNDGKDVFITRQDQNGKINRITIKGLAHPEGFASVDDLDTANMLEINA